MDVERALEAHVVLRAARRDDGPREVARGGRPIGLQAARGAVHVVRPRVAWGPGWHVDRGGVRSRPPPGPIRVRSGRAWASKGLWGQGERRAPAPGEQGLRE